MKKGFLFFIIFIMIADLSYSKELQNFGFAFNGRWVPSEDPLLLEDNGIQDIQNMRRWGSGVRGVSGHTAINSTAWNATYKYPKNIFHFSKDRPSESHLLVLSTDANGANGQIYDNTTAIPLAGNFATTAMHSDSASAGLGRFSAAPQGNVIYANGDETLIWGGDETQILGFEVYDPEGSFYYDYSDVVINTLTDANNVASMFASGASDSFTSLLLHCDGADAGTTFTDDGVSGRLMTAAGNAQTDTAYKKFGSASGLFDGSGDTVYTADADAWAFGGSAFTIDCWIKVDDLSSERCIVSQMSGATNYWEFYVDTDGSLNFDHVASGVADISLESNASDISTGTEYHVAIVADGSDNFYLYINGLLVKSITDTDTIADLTGHLSIGGLSIPTPEDYFDGWIDEFRISTGKARYSANFEVPIAAYSGSGTVYMRIASPRPIDGFKAYIETANTSTGTMSAYYWDGSAWTSVSSLSDGTASGGISLAQTGSVTWTSTINTAKKRLINSLEAYWYKIEISTCDSTTTVSQITLDAPIQAITNIWDGTMHETAAVYTYDDSAYNDYTAEAQSDATSTVVVLDSLTTSTEYLLLGFINRMQGFQFYIPAKKGNSTAAILTVSYWNGSDWTILAPFTDGTSENGKSLSNSGIISFEHPGISNEFSTTIEDEIPLYYYKLQWSANLDGETEIYRIAGIPYIEALKSYKFSHQYQERCFLLSETSSNKNRAQYSAYNSPYVFNGDDSGSLYFGGDEELTAACNIYNVFQTTGYYQMLVTKKNETYRVFGDGPSNWEVNKLSGNIGCVAPLSMAVCEVADISENTKRHVAMWQSTSGIVMCDGATITNISDDIKNYWDETDATFIPSNRQDDSVGWYDPDLDSYKLLISSGSGQSSHNIELEYSLKYKTWTKIYRENATGANPLQVGGSVKDTSGSIYTYGATNEGVVYRLENGNTWNDTADIAQYIQTKDLFLSSSRPLWADTAIKYFRLLYEDKDSATESIRVTHYGDRVETTASSTGQRLISDIKMSTGPIDTQSCILGRNLIHSLKFSSTTDETDGMELYGLSLYFEEFEGITDH